MPATTFAASRQLHSLVPGEALTRYAITAAMTFAFSMGNVTVLCLHLGIRPQLAWLTRAAVDLSVVGLLTGVRFLSLNGYTDG
jgi:hypothetical protein